MRTLTACALFVGSMGCVQTGGLTDGEYEYRGIPRACSETTVLDATVAVATMTLAAETYDAVGAYHCVELHRAGDRGIASIFADTTYEAGEVSSFELLVFNPALGLLSEGLDLTTESNGPSIKAYTSVTYSFENPVVQVKVLVRAKSAAATTSLRLSLVDE